LEYENFETHESIDLTFGMGDYVGDITPHAKIQNDRHIESVPANR